MWCLTDFINSINVDVDVEIFTLSVGENPLNDLGTGARFQVWVCNQVSGLSQEMQMAAMAANSDKQMEDVRQVFKM